MPRDQLRIGKVFDLIQSFSEESHLPDSLERRPRGKPLGAWRRDMHHVVDSASIGVVLREIIECFPSARALASYIGISPSTLSDFAAGTRLELSDSTLFAFSNAALLAGIVKFKDATSPMLSGGELANAWIDRLLAAVWRPPSPRRRPEAAPLDWTRIAQDARVGRLRYLRDVLPQGSVEKIRRLPQTSFSEPLALVRAWPQKEPVLVERRTLHAMYGGYFGSLFQLAHVVPRSGEIEVALDDRSYVVLVSTIEVRKCRQLCLPRSIDFAASRDG